MIYDNLLKRFTYSCHLHYIKLSGLYNKKKNGINPEEIYVQLISLENFLTILMCKQARIGTNRPFMINFLCQVTVIIIMVVIFFQETFAII